MAALASAPTTSSNPLPNPAAAVKSPVVAPPSTPPVTDVTPSLWDQALQMAQQSLAAQTAPLQNEITANNAEADANAQAETADAAAAAKMLEQIAPAISSIYGNGVNDIGTLAKGFSTDFQNTVDQAGGNVNDLLAKIGAPAGQMVDPSKARDAADVLYGLGGFIPGQSFAQQGAAYAGAAAELPASAILMGQVNSAKVYTDNAAANAKINQSIAELAGKLPGDAMTNYKDLSTLALNDAKFRETLKKDGIDAAYKQATLKLDALKYSTSVKEFNIKSGQAQQRLQLDAAKFAQSTLNQNRNYALALERVGISAKRLQLSIIGNEYKAQHGGFTQAQITKFQTKLDGIYANPPKSLDKGMNGYQTFLSTALKKGIPFSTAVQYANRVFPTDQQNLGPLQSLPSVAQDWAGAVSAAGLTPGQANAEITGRAPAPVSDPQKRSYQSYAFNQFGKFGWSEQDAAALQKLWDGESGWNPGATNKSSGAAGIPQALGHTLPPDYATNPHAQINWGLDYIHGRYGSPARAWAFWQATVNKDAALAPPDLQAEAAQWIQKGYAGY